MSKLSKLKKINYKKQNKINANKLFNLFYIDRFASLIEATTKFNIFEWCYRCVVQENMLSYELRDLHSFKSFFRSSLILYLFFFMLYLSILWHLHNDINAMNYFFKIDSGVFNIIDPVLFLLKCNNIEPKNMTNIHKFCLDFEMVFFIALFIIVTINNNMKLIRKYMDWRLYEHVVDLGYWNIDYFEDIYQSDICEDKENIYWLRNELVQDRDIQRLRRYWLIEIDLENSILNVIDEKINQKSIDYVDNYNNEQEYFVYWYCEESTKDDIYLERIKQQKKAYVF